MTGSFYVARAGAFHSSENARGPWNPDHQHAGPPSALVGRALEQFEPKPNSRIVRVTNEILRPVPIVPLEVEVSMARSGRSVELFEAALHADGREVMRSRAWRMRTTDLHLPSSARA